MHKTIIYLGILIFGFTAISYWNFWSIIKPPKIKINQKPSDFNLPAQNITIKAEDNLKLSGWYIPKPNQEKPRPAIILLHGYPAEKADMLSIASTLYSDFDLLLMDLRYFGESKGDYTTLGVKEKTDTKKAIDFLESKGHHEIGVFGFSLGGAVGIITANEDKRIKSIVSYTSFSDTKTLGEESFSKLWILKKPMVELMLLWSRLHFKEDLREISPIKSAANLQTPILITHSRDDEQTSFNHAMRFKKSLAKNPNAQFFFHDGFHGELPIDFYERTKNFFKESFSKLK